MEFAPKGRSEGPKREFLEWFVGFTDGGRAGNFNIKLTDFNNNNFKYVQFTSLRLQIGLHKDDITVLEYIMNNLKCGHISKSDNRINYFVNDINSLKNNLLINWIRITLKNKIWKINQLWTGDGYSFVEKGSFPYPDEGWIWIFFSYTKKNCILKKIREKNPELDN